MNAVWFKSSLLQNAGALYLVQIANYVIPLLMLPFLTRTLGTAGYGQFATLQAIAAYGLVLTDYGFSLSATRKVAAALERGEDVSALYRHVSLARVLLAGLATFLMGSAVAAVPYLTLDFSLLLSLMLLVLGNALTPLWLFQGFQRMGLVSIVMLSARLLSAGLTVLLVRTPHDVDTALWSQAIGTVLPSMVALWQAGRLLARSAQRAPLPPAWLGLKEELADGWPLFQTLLVSAIMTNSGVLVLGAFAGAHVAGGYAAVERIAKGVSSMLVPITQTIYPRVTIGFTRSVSAGTALLRRFGPPLLTLSLLQGVLLVAVFAWGGVAWLFGEEYQRYAGILLVLSPWMVFGVANNLLGIQYLTNVGEQAWYARSFTLSSLTALALFVVLSGLFSYWGVAWGLVVGEGLLTALLWWRTKQLAPSLFREGRT